MVRVQLTTSDGETHSGEIDIPPGAPGRPVSRDQLAQKVRDCVGDRAETVLAAGWADLPDLFQGASTQDASTQDSSTQKDPT